MKKYLLASIFIVSLFFGLMVQDISTGEDSSTAEPLDCREETHTCQRGNISQYPSSCETWHPWEKPGELDCDYTSENLDSITYITDKGNYIDLPFTEEDYNVEVISEAQTPWDMAFLPDGAKIWTNTQGEIKIQRNRSEKVIGTIETPENPYKTAMNTDLTGIAVDPDFEDNRYIYIAYPEKIKDENSTLYSHPIISNKISRFKLTEKGLQKDKTLLNVSGAEFHVTGRLDFGPDGKLYATAGDSYQGYMAADNSSLEGKILRINPDGTVPEDNPFGNEIYSRGHRNPQGLAWHPETEEIYAPEHGPWRHDEINHVEKGESYGWPGYKCGEKSIFFGKWSSEYNLTPEEFYENTEPVKCFDDWTMAPSGATFVDEEGHPWYGDMFVAGLRGGQVYRLRFKEGEPTEGEIFYVSDGEPEISLRIRHVEFRDGSLRLGRQERNSQVNT